MATSVTQHAPVETVGQNLDSSAQKIKPAKHDVYTQLHYHKVPADGSFPRPVYVGWVSLRCML
jgi:hypothetical protein